MFFKFFFILKEFYPFYFLIDSSQLIFFYPFGTDGPDFFFLISSKHESINFGIRGKMKSLYDESYNTEQRNYYSNSFSAIGITKEKKTRPRSDSNSLKNFEWP